MKTFANKRIENTIYVCIYTGIPIVVYNAITLSSTRLTLPHNVIRHIYHCDGAFVRTAYLTVIQSIWTWRHLASQSLRDLLLEDLDKAVEYESDTVFMD